MKDFSKLTKKQCFEEFASLGIVVELTYNFETPPIKKRQGENGAVRVITGLQAKSFGDAFKGPHLKDFRDAVKWASERLLP